MTRQVPVLPTIAVAIIVATMVALGFWQLGRAHERDAVKERMIAHARLPMIEYPYAQPLREDLLFRRLSANCTAVRSWETRGGEGANGENGWRHIATCVSPRGTTFKADMGVSASPVGQPAWQGGRITGAAVRAPDMSGMSDRIMHRQAPRALMVVAETPAPGLLPSRQPDPSEETNSSWAYTGQWFLFALTALVIYVLALRKRWRERPDGRPI
jgi:cytochrome oxidase assembly protein ShyY1